MDNGRVPAEPGSRPTDQAPTGLAAPRVDPSRVVHLKATYYDLAVNTLREMIANERLWLLDAVAIGLRQAKDSVMYEYCSNTLHDAHVRAVRVAELAKILNMMTRNVENRDSDRSGEAGETTEIGSTEGESAVAKPIAQPIDGSA